MIAITFTFQKSVPALSLTSVEYVILLGSETTSDGCRPIPKRAGVWLDPGRESESEKKRAAGAEEAGVMPKRLEAKAAPSGVLFVPGVISRAILELRGKARPRMPSKLEARGSEAT